MYGRDIFLWGYSKVCVKSKKSFGASPTTKNKTKQKSQKLAIFFFMFLACTIVVILIYTGVYIYICILNKFIWATTNSSTCVHYGWELRLTILSFFFKKKLKKKTTRYKKNKRRRKRSRNKKKTKNRKETSVASIADEQREGRDFEHSNRGEQQFCTCRQPTSCGRSLHLTAIDIDSQTRLFLSGKQVQVVPLTGCRGWCEDAWVFVISPFAANRRGTRTGTARNSMGVTNFCCCCCSAAAAPL